MVNATKDHVASFKADGFLALDRISSPEEVARLRELYDDVIADPGGLRLIYHGLREDGTEGLINQVFSPDFKHPELLETEYMRNARRFAAALLEVPDDEVTYGGLMFIYKPAGEGRDTPWHQDEAYWNDRNAERCHSLSVWMPLDDVTIESGCMQYVPGTNAGDVLDHIKPDGPEPLHLKDPIDLSAAVPCEIPAGGATIHYCRTVHFGGPNLSTVPRRAMTTIFHGPSTPRDVPLEKAWLEGGRVWTDAQA
jgi:hypothetical protein